MASRMFCGIGFWNVSGRKASASAPETRAGRPRSSMGRGAHSTARLDTKGQARPKTRAVWICGKFVAPFVEIIQYIVEKMF